MALSPCGWGNWPCARGETCTANINTIGFKNPERDVAEYSSPRFMAANRERWWKHINQYHFCWKNQPNADRSTKRHFDKLIIVSSKKTLMNKIMIIPTSSKSVKFGGTKWNGATRPTNYRDGGAKFEQIDKIGNCLASRLISSSSSSFPPPPSPPPPPPKKQNNTQKISRQR